MLVQLPTTSEHFSRSFSSLSIAIESFGLSFGEDFDGSITTAAWSRLPVDGGRAINFPPHRRWMNEEQCSFTDERMDDEPSAAVNKLLY